MIDENASPPVQFTKRGAMMGFISYLVVAGIVTLVYL
jgi:hypothetical protein